MHTDDSLVTEQFIIYKIAAHLHYSCMYTNRISFSVVALLFIILHALLSNKCIVLCCM